MADQAFNRSLCVLTGRPTRLDGPLSVSEVLAACTLLGQTIPQGVQAAIEASVKKSGKVNGQLLAGNSAGHFSIDEKALNEGMSAAALPIHERIALKMRLSELGLMSGPKPVLGNSPFARLA